MLGNFNLAQVYIEQLEEWDKAIPPLEVLVKNREEAIWIYTYLGNAYTAKGLYNKVEELYLFYLENFPEDMRIQAGLANNYIYLGEYDRALSEYEEVFSSTSNYLGLSIIKSMIELLRGNPDETEKELWTLLEHEEPINQMRGIIRLIPIYYLQGKFEKAEKYIKRADNLLKDLQDKELWRMKLYHETRGYIYLRTGRIQEALDEYNKMWDVAVEDEAIDYKIIALEGKGSAYLKLKELDRAHETADELKLLLEKQANKKLMRHYFRLVGKIAAERNNNPEAIDNLEKALSLVSVGPQDIPPGFIEPLALAYYRAGNLDRAREEFERITRITMGRINYGDIYAKSYYMLGKIHEQQGDSAKALEQYEKFLTLWKDADPGIAEVDDAKERLAELRE
jgi:tetratricopeptide (TPR) repeat protein